MPNTVLLEIINMLKCFVKTKYNMPEILNIPDSNNKLLCVLCTKCIGRTHYGLV
jgi:hypothetical protein